MLYRMIVTFFGHSKIGDLEEVRQWLERTAKDLVLRGADRFYLGGYGDFDLLAASVLYKLSKGNPSLQVLLVLPYLKQETNGDSYDGSVYPPLERVPKRLAIIKRNEWMVEQADVVVAYVLHDWGGASKMLRYALRKQKQIVRFPEE